MAAGTNLVIPESRKRAVGWEAMAESAIRPESRPRIDTRMRIDVLRVRELENDRPLVLVARVGQHVFAAGGRKHGVAFDADFLLYVLVEIVLMAGRTLIVTGAFESHRTGLLRQVTSVAIDPNLLQMVFVEVERGRRLRLSLRFGLRRRRLSPCRRFLPARRCDRERQANAGKRKAGQRFRSVGHSVSPRHAEAKRLAVLNARPKNRVIRIQSVVHVEPRAAIEIEGRVCENAFIAGIGDDRELIAEIQ
jgi:hypothetical protein